MRIKKLENSILPKAQKTVRRTHMVVVFLIWRDFKFTEYNYLLKLTHF